MEKIMLITGTRKGIGRFLADEYLKSGFIVAGCSRSESDLVHENYSHYIVDVTDEKSIKGMITSVYKKHGRVDILLNNAGIASMNHTLLTPTSMVDKLFKTNFNGTFIFSREASRFMSKNKFGRIVNFSTVAVPMKIEGEAVYAASKSAVETLTKIMAYELAPMGITCNCIGPTPINTDLIKNVGEEKVSNLISRQAIKQPAEFSDVKNVIDFYISEKSKMITGQVIYLGGIS